MLSLTLPTILILKMHLVKLRTNSNTCLGGKNTFYCWLRECALESVPFKSEGSRFLSTREHRTAPRGQMLPTGALLQDRVRPAALIGCLQ